jgi:uncharacterized membrane protein YccC
MSSASQVKGSFAQSADLQNVEYALKCAAAALLAYYIALRIGLQNPFWALTTCYITAAPQRLAGAIMSKAVFRTCGTLSGGIAAVVLVPQFVNAPLVLSAVLALWVGLCAAVAALDRTPRSYTFVLAGYTAGIIGFPSVGAPDQVFDTAILREQEIILGILCTTLMHAAFLPRTLTTQMRERIGQILREVEEGARQSVAGAGDAAPDKKRPRLALELNELTAFSVQLPFDTERILPDLRALNLLQDQLTLLLPIASAVEDRVTELSKLPDGLDPAVAALLEQIKEWLAQRRGDSYEAGALLIERARRLAATGDFGGVWRRMLSINLLMRLADLVSVRRNARALHDSLISTAPAGFDPTLLQARPWSRGQSFHLDHLNALWIGSSAALTVFLGCLFWIATAWPAGATAVLISGVGAGLFGGFPNAPQTMRLFLSGVIGGVVIAALYGFVILPRVSDLVMYGVVLAPALLLFGVILARPALAGLLGLAAAMGFINTVGLADTYQGDFAGFANSALALCMGTALSAAVFSVTRMGSAGYAALGLLRAAYRDVADRARRTHLDSLAWTGRMLDRVGLLAANGSAAGGGARAVAVLTDLRTGHIAGSLRELGDSSNQTQQRRIMAILADLATYYDSLDPLAPRPPPGPLLEHIDAGVWAFSVDADPTRGREGMSLLAGLRRNLFPFAAPLRADVN